MLFQTIAWDLSIIFQLLLWSISYKFVLKIFPKQDLNDI